MTPPCVKVVKYKVKIAETVYLCNKLVGTYIKSELRQMDAIKDWPAPKLRKQAQPFIGMISLLV